MDIYGWQHGRTDELSKQQVYQGGCAVGSGMPMPAPTGAPWQIGSMPWGLPQPHPAVVQFTAQPQPQLQLHSQLPPHLQLQPQLQPPHLQLHPQTSTSPKPPLHCKRKPADIEPPIPAKQLITEEKMAEHLSGLHISAEYRAHALEPPAQPPRLHLSEELKSIKAEPLLPEALLERLEKPCMSLVVWQPRETILDRKDKEEEKRESDSPSVNRGRKGVLVAEVTDIVEIDDDTDFNVMDVEM